MSAVLRKEPNMMLVQWTGITQAAPNGDWVDIAGWLISSVDWEGTPGAAPALQLQASNGNTFPEATQSALTQYSASAAGLIAGSPNAVVGIRPALASGGDGTTNMSVNVLLVR